MNAVEPPSAATSPPASPSATPGSLPTYLGLKCASRQSMAATLDYFEPPEDMTLDEAVQPWLDANPGFTTAVDEHQRDADVYLVRPDGSVAATINVVRRTDSKHWNVNTFSACLGVSPYGR